MRNYSRALRTLEAWLVCQDGRTEAGVQPVDLAGFISGLRERLTADDVNTFIGALRLYFGWLLEEGLRPDNPARSLRFLRSIPKPVEPLNAEECTRLLRWTEKAAKERFGTYRSAVMAVFLLDTGLRLSECLGMRLTDLDTEEGKVVVRANKTHSVRLVPVSLPLRRWLRKYLARRLRVQAEGEPVCAEDFLFCGEHGGLLSVREAEVSIKHIGRKTGIPRLHPHLFRHTWAVHSLQNGAPLPVVMRAGGWRKLETVSRYTQFTDAMVKEAMEKASPLAGLTRR